MQCHNHKVWGLVFVLFPPKWNGTGLASRVMYLHSGNGWFQKISTLWHWQLFGILKAKGVPRTGDPKAWRALTIGIQRARVGEISRGDRQVQKRKWTDNTADYHKKQDTRGASINHACVNIHLQRESNKIWVVHWAPQAVKLMNFLSENHLWQRPTLCASNIYSWRNRFGGIWTSVIHSIKGKLGRIYSRMF